VSTPLVAVTDHAVERYRDVTFVCLWDRPRGELLVVTLWEAGEDPQVPRRFTDALKVRRRSG
jgi:hypothetical protein